MKIKTKKKMYIGGLLEHVRKNELRGRYFRVMDESRYIKVTPDGDIYFDVDFRFKPDDIFTVEVEEELTEDTVFDELVFVYDVYAHRPSSGLMVRKSIQNVLEHKYPIYKIYALVDRSLVFIWSAESGIPESGVLEVGAE